MKNLVKYLAIHILCGILAVYLAGIVDKNTNHKNAAPVGTLFVLGPIGLLVSTIGIIATSCGKIHLSSSAFHKIYDKGYGK